MTRWTLTVPLPLLSANDRIVNGRDKVSRAIYANRRDAWAQILTTLARYHGIPAATGKRRVTFIRLMGKGQRAFDDDDLIGGCKLVRDAMRRPKPWTKRVGKARVSMLTAGASLIVDDSARWLEATYVQERAADGVTATRIVIEEAT